MKGEIVRSIECNSTISPFLGRWQNLTESQKHTVYIHKTTIEIEKNIYIHNQWMYKNYKDGKKYILVFSPFLSLEPERKEEERSLGIRMCTSFLASWISTRRGMASEVKNPGRNNVVLCSWETANAFKIGKELNKKKCVSPWNMRAEKAGECWKNNRMLKSFYQK